MFCYCAFFFLFVTQSPERGTAPVKTYSSSLVLDLAGKKFTQTFFHFFLNFTGSRKLQSLASILNPSLRGFETVQQVYK